MKESNTKITILEACTSLLAQYGYAGTTMRNVAETVGVKPSVLYYYFPSKAELMRALRQHLNIRLDTGLKSLPPAPSTAAMLRARLRFQIEEREAIVALLQYFMAVKQDFPHQDGGYVPERAYRHMREVIDRGIAEGRFHSSDPAFDAKILTHLVNGFLLEFYPHNMTQTETDTLTEKLAQFIERSLKATQV